jgi:aspartate/methionine/tyrosine aminotransferase
VLLDVRGTGLGSPEFALGLLEREHVAVLPCDGFGPSAAGHLRIALSPPTRASPKRASGSCGSRRGWRSGRIRRSL